MAYIPFEITVDDKMFAAAMHEDGKIYVRVGKLDMESINHLQVHASSLGGVLMNHLNQ